MPPKRAAKEAIASSSADPRTLGRTRNAKAAPNPTAASTRPKRASASAADEQPEPKKARIGRTAVGASKPEKATTSKSKQAKAATPANNSKQRGRPPKVPKAPVVAEKEGDNESEDAAEKPPPKKRGRPSKSSEPAPMPSKLPAKSSAKTAKTSKATNSASELERNHQATPSRGRGRPATKKTTVEAPKAESRGKKRSGPVDDNDEPEATEPAPKRQRGRPSTRPTTNNEDDKLTADGPSYWLMKAEPESRVEKGVDVKFSIDDLSSAKEPEPWNGVRNHVAKNNMKSMKKGELAFFYHSNCKTPAIVGVMEIVEEASPDESAFDVGDPYYDAKAKRDNPNGWVIVRVEFREKFENPVTLEQLKNLAQDNQEIENMQLLKQSRLSVSRVTPEAWNFIRKQAGVSAASIDQAGEPQSFGNPTIISDENTASALPKLASPDGGVQSGDRATSVPAPVKGNLAPKKAGSRASSRARSVPPTGPTAESGPAGPQKDTPVSQAMARVAEETEA